MQQDWQRRCREEQNDKSIKPKVLAEFSKKTLTRGQGR
jgi:hypothetical protein